MQQQGGNVILKFINEMRPLHRLGISVLVAFSAFFVLLPQYELLMRIMFTWIIFSVIYLSISWIILFYRKVEDIRIHANIDDGSKVFVFLMVIISSFAAMLMVLLLMISPEAQSQDKWVFLIIAISGMLLSWTMVHSIFTFHYAHLYYDKIKKENKNASEGLIFPQTEEPDYIDFAYFSFVIGCTFQVSDVSITTRKMRRIVLMHGLLSFALNTFVVALTINMIAGLNK